MLNPAEGKILDWVRGERLHHAVILSGGRAAQRRKLVVEMAKILFCENKKPSGDVCQKCTHCYRLQNGLHPDFVLFDSKATDLVRIESIRQFCGELEIGQTEALYKIGVLDNADRMNGPAANAFLKTLEEPKEGRLLWLLASQPNAMLATIRSRCLEMSLGPSEEEELPDDTAEIEKAFSDWAQTQQVPEVFSDWEKDREKCLRWIGFLQEQIRNAAWGEKKGMATDYLSQWSQQQLLMKFDKAVNLEGRLRSQANYALMLEVFLRSELAGKPAAQRT